MFQAILKNTLLIYAAKAGLQQSPTLPDEISRNFRKMTVQTVRHCISMLCRKKQRN